MNIAITTVRIGIQLGLGGFSACLYGNFRRCAVYRGESHKDQRNGKNQRFEHKGPL